MKNDHIIVKGARENNLKSLDVKIPKNKFVVMTGLSGSGKSSLAFETLYQEGQRRYMEKPAHCCGTRKAATLSLTFFRVAPCA